MEKSVAHIALFAALIAVLGLVPKIDLLAGVPITAQSLGVMLCGTVLGARRGAAAVLLFVALVALGLPLLAGGRGGLGVFAAPSAGYLIGFPIAAFVAGAVMQRLAHRPVAPAALIAAVLGGIGALHICGIIGLSVMLDKTLWQAALIDLPFLPGDMIKAGLAALITQNIARLRPEALLSRA